jgi:hypothetical protein
MLKEVWLKSFGKKVYDKHRDDFKTLLCGTKMEWEHAYLIVSSSITTDAEKQSKLEIIYKDPSTMPVGG